MSFFSVCLYDNLYLVIQIYHLPITHTNPYSVATFFFLSLCQTIECLAYFTLEQNTQHVLFLLVSSDQGTEQHTHLGKYNTLVSLIKALFELRDVRIPLCCHPRLHYLLRFQVNNSHGIYGCAWCTLERNPILYFSIETQWPMSSRSFSLLCCTNYCHYYLIKFW